jgi:hypothetical protein
LPPALTPAKLTLPATSTGVDRFVVVPSPSWPNPLSPQQYAAPLATRPQVWVPFTLIAANVTIPETATGVDLFVVVPSPSWPNELSPQQYTAPADVRPQA